MVWLGRDGFPVEFIKGRPVLNAVRWLLLCSLSRSIRERGRWKVVNGWLVDSYGHFDPEAPVQRRRPGTRRQHAAEGLTDDRRPNL